MEFEIKDVIYIVGIIVSAIISFLSTRHKLKDYFRDKNDIIKEDIIKKEIEIKKEIDLKNNHLIEQITNLRLELKELKEKDNLQQLIIDQIGKQMDELIPRLLDAIQNKKVRK